MANLKNKSNRFISLGDLQAEFAKDYSLPLDIITHEIEKPHVCLLSDGTAEMQFFFRTDDKGTGEALSVMEDATGFWVEWEATFDELVKCIEFSPLIRLTFLGNGFVEIQGERIEIDDDYVKEFVRGESLSIIQLWFCLFGAEVVEQAWSDYLSEQPKSFKKELEAVMSPLEKAA